MRKVSCISFLTPLLAAACLAGCGPAYYPGDSRYPDDADGRYGDQAGDVQGTVESVDPRAHLIYLAREEDDDQDLLALSYDDDTVVRYQGRTFRPEALERGDRIQVSVEGDDRDDRGTGRLFAERVDVLYDVNQGGPPRGRDDDGGRRAGDPRGDLRGTIRAINTRAHTLEITGPDRGGTIVVGYDDHTPVHFQGRLYTPENLERGDEVRIRTHDYDGQPFAQDIFVVASRSGLDG